MTALATNAAVMRSSCGSMIDLDVTRWRRDADAIEIGLLETLRDPVIDVGCGPGRIVRALGMAGRIALGVDVSNEAVAEARRRGTPVLGRSVFEPLPGERRWASVVLFDGNIGIGGDPVALLQRIAELLAPGGVVLTEVASPGTQTGPLTVRLEHDGGIGPWFPWARVSVDEIERLERAANLEPDGTEHHQGRWFARAIRP